MKKKYYPIISIALATVILTSAVLLVQINKSDTVETSKNLALVDHSDTYATISTVYQRKTFSYDGTYWLFYCNGSSIFYTSSPDGSNWGASTPLTDGLSASAMSVWSENGVVHYAYAAGSSPIIYMRGEIVGKEIHWGEQKNVVLGVSTYEYYNAYCTVDSDGRPWISFIRYDNGSPEEPWSVQVVRADSPSGEHWSAPMQASENSFLPVRPCLVPLSESQMYAIWVTQNGSEGALWDGTSWQPAEKISSRHPIIDYDYSTASLNDEVYLALPENNTDNVYGYRRLANGEWQETLLAQQATVAAVLSVDASTKTLYCTWLHDHTLQLKKMINGDWADVNIENTVISSPSAFSASYNVDDGKLDVTLLDLVSTLPDPLLYKLYYFVIPNL